MCVSGAGNGLLVVCALNLCMVGEDLIVWQKVVLERLELVKSKNKIGSRCFYIHGAGTELKGCNAGTDGSGISRLLKIVDAGPIGGAALYPTRFMIVG